MAVDRRRAGASAPGRSRWAGWPMLLLTCAGLLDRSALGHREPAAPPAKVAGVDMHGRPVRLDPGAGLPPEQKQEQDAKPDGAGRFVVPSVGLDVPLGTMNEVADSVVPPGFTSAYRIDNLGTPTAPASGTVYVAMHSLRWGATGPGNYLFALDTGTSKVTPGAAIDVGGTRYVVDAATTVPKDDLPDTPEIWDDVPGRLVVLTCLEKPDNSPSVDNFVITAHLDPAGDGAP
ncbi:class F sortase [Kitasatospora sp. NPDC092948]|uniref:class F sortase n=1 Tax=Kitasatospora sp. NPDC092948 TaxID=3364088 RepID=UPI003804CEAA